MRESLTYIMEFAGFLLIIWGVYALLGLAVAAILAGLLLLAGAVALERETAS